MQELVKIASPAILALLGTLAVAILGYRQWKKTHNYARYGAFLTERQTAYKIAWEKLEAAHLYVRSEEFSEDRFLELVRDVNVHLIRTALHLDDGEKERLNAYLDSLRHLGRVLTNAKASNTKKMARRTLHATGVLPQEIANEIHGLGAAYNDVESRRKEIIAHFRTLLGADFVL